MINPVNESRCTITTDDAVLNGFLVLPRDTQGIVVFAHGSGSSRFSRRNNAVAAFLREAQLGTLLFDLLTAAEEKTDVVTREHRFDISLLSRRLAGAVVWLGQQAEGTNLPIGLFGSSTGAAAALIVAAEIPDRIGAVVSRGGRVDLAGNYLGKVQAPALLIVGGRDVEVLRLNREALERMQCTAELAVVAHATHLFEEAGTLHEVEIRARDWFTRYLRQASAAIDAQRS
jgi:pimeloyl-ACP methyl ester carboxylesterase